MQGINFKAFDLGGHEIARRVWKDYYAKVRAVYSCLACGDLLLVHVRQHAAIPGCHRHASAQGQNVQNC